MPRPGPRGVTLPLVGDNGSVRTAPARSRYSNQDAVGDDAMACALASTKVWFDNGSEAASACPAAEIQPVIPPIFPMSTIARSLAPAAMACAIPLGNHQFSPV